MTNRNTNTITTNTCEEHEVFDVVDVWKIKPDQFLELCFCCRKVLQEMRDKKKIINQIDNDILTTAMTITMTMGSHQAGELCEEVAEVIG